MAEAMDSYPLGSPQEHVSMCEKHDSMPIELICEDCEKFICSKCLKKEHKDHNWNTINTAATLKARGLMKFVREIEEKDIRNIDEEIKMASQKIESNCEKYEIEIAKLRSHYDAMVKILDDFKKEHEASLTRHLERENAHVRVSKSNLEGKEENIMKLVKYLKENGSTMHDVVLLKTHRELTNLIAFSSYFPILGHFEGLYMYEYKSGKINEEVLRSMMGNTRIPSGSLLSRLSRFPFMHL